MMSELTVCDLRVVSKIPNTKVTIYLKNLKFLNHRKLKRDNLIYDGLILLNDQDDVGNFHFGKNWDFFKGIVFSEGKEEVISVDQSDLKVLSPVTVNVANQKKEVKIAEKAENLKNQKFSFTGLNPIISSRYLGPRKILSHVYTSRGINRCQD